MVKIFKYTQAFLRLIRIQNLLIIAATMYMLRFFVFIPLLKHDGFMPQMSPMLFFLLACATMLVAAAGYVINDYFDRKADLINRPSEVVLGRLLSHRAGMFWHVVLTGLGVLFGAYVSYRIGHLKFSVVFPFVSGLLWFYSTTYKRQVLLGNIIVALLVAMVPLIVLLFELPMLLDKYQLRLTAWQSDTDYLVYWILGYSVFAFLLTLIREITKDLEDFEGDFAFGRQTIPIAWGAGAAKMIVLFLTAITIGLIVYVMFKADMGLLTVLYGALLIVVPLLVFGVMLQTSNSKKGYANVSLILKLIMLAGIFYTVVASLWVF